jgi:hypothetical protein
LIAEIEEGDEQVKADAIRIGNYTDGQFPTDSKEFAKRIFYTVFMGSENRLVQCIELLLIFFLLLLQLFYRQAHRLSIVNAIVGICIIYSNR